MTDAAAALRGLGVVYFGNDWNAENRTSSHHGATRLAQRMPVLYVDSPGMRAPNASGRDLKKAWRKLALRHRIRIQPTVHIRRQSEQFVEPAIFVKNQLFQARNIQIRHGRTFFSLDGDYLASFGLSIIRDRRHGVQSVYLVRGETVLKFTLAEAFFEHNGEKVPQDAAPYLYRGKMMIPFRPVAEALHQITWKNNQKQLYAFA